MSATLYPKSPQLGGIKLTSLTSAYQLKATLAIMSVFLFFVLYFTLVAALGYLVYLALIYPMFSINKLTILMKLGAIAGSVMLFVFTLKFIFKLKNHKPENRLKLNIEKHPELLNFIHNICKETGAPKPKSVYVDPDVNAYVSYSNMWLSLFLPVKKDLTIGLGLVDCLNITEFKAVMAHEFGHFAQRSMKIGSYIISANTIIHDMIFNRDKWDQILDQWRASDIRLSAAAWVITPIIWLIRHLLSLFYQFLNIMYSSLSREMEFNADKVAVSVAGSDAIISALWKLDDGASSWNITLNNAYLASQKNMYVKNLYHHNLLSLKRNEVNQLEKFNGLLEDERGGKKYFASSENSKVGMYASHPPNDHRENNAKSPYVACEEDQRSPWLLFNESVKIQERATHLIYEKYLRKSPKDYSKTEVFESFISAEAKGKELLEEYYNTFENRFIQIPEKVKLNELADQLKEVTLEGIQEAKKELNELMEPVRNIESLMIKVQQIADGTSKEKSFTYNNMTFDKNNLQEGYNKLNRKREEIFDKNFLEWDSKYCAQHLKLSRKLNQQDHLLALYEQHTKLCNFYRLVINVRAVIYNGLNELQSRNDVTQPEVDGLGGLVKSKVIELNKSLNEFDEIKFVELPNLDNIDELKNAIVEGGCFINESGDIFQNGGFNRILESIENAVIHCQRIDQKSIVEILAFNKQLREQLN